jgi:hypothetical protein
LPVRSVDALLTEPAVRKRLTRLRRHGGVD